jgi:hypothetical protein
LIDEIVTCWFFNPTKSIGIYGILLQNTQEKSPTMKGPVPGNWMGQGAETVQALRICQGPQFYNEQA